MTSSRPWFAVLGGLWLCCALLGCEDFNPPEPAAPSTDSIVDAASAEPPEQTPAQPEPTVDAGTAPVPAGKLDFTRAQAGSELIFVPNPSAGRVVVLDPRDGSSRQVGAGSRPELLAVSPEANVALCLDAASTRATVVAVEAGDVASAGVELGVGYNALAVSATGRYALAYHSADHYDPFGAPGPLSQVSVVELDPDGPRAAPVTVGLRPRQVQFSSSEGRVWVTSEAGVSVLDVSQALDDGSALAAPQDFGPQYPVEALELRLSTLTNIVYGFEPGSSLLLALDLGDGSVRSVALDALLGVDLDAGEDGPTLTDAALAQEDERIVLAVPELPGLVVLSAQSLELVETIPLAGQDVGRLAVFGDDSTVLVWSSDPELRDARLVSLAAPDAVRRVLLAAPPDQVHVGATLLVLTHAAGDEAGPGYSVLGADGAVRFQPTAQAVDQLALGPAAAPLYVGVPGLEGRDQVQAVDPDTLTLDPFEVDGAPLGVGQVRGAQLGFAEVDHPDGRVVLFDWSSDSRRVVTGFRILDRVRP